MSSVAGRGDLTDGQWERLRRWIPAPAKRGRRITRSRRDLANGVAWRVRVGSPWRDVPERYGPWSTVYWLFRTWQTEGVWALTVKMLLALLDQGGTLTWTVSVDSAAGARTIDDLPPDLTPAARWDDGTDLSGGQWQKPAIGRGRMRRDPLPVFDGGEVAEAGKHEGLIGVGGKYAELYELQPAACRRPGERPQNRSHATSPDTDGKGT